MNKIISTLVKYKRSILISLTAFVAFGFSINSSYIVQSLGCGYMEALHIIDCGFYAGFPAPFAKYSVENVKKLKNKHLLNPTTYYKYRFSPIPENREFAEKFLSEGNIFPFYLQNSEHYDFNTGMFVLNSILWLAPSAFLIIVFF